MGLDIQFFIQYVLINSPESHQTYLLFGVEAHSEVSHLLVVWEETELHDKLNYPLMKLLC